MSDEASAETLETPSAAAAWSMRLDALWQASVRDGMVRVLREVFTADVSLSSIVVALRFLQQQDGPWEAIRLAEVVTPARPSQAASSSPASRKTQAPAERFVAQSEIVAPSGDNQPPQVPRRAFRPFSTLQMHLTWERSEKDTERLKARLVTFLVSSELPSSTEGLQRMLAHCGERLELADVHRLLMALAQEGRVAKQSGVGRGWKFLPSPTPPQGMVIRKMNTLPAPSAPPTEAESAQMRSLGKPATDVEWEHSRQKLLEAAALLQLPLHRGTG